MHLDVDTLLFTQALISFLSAGILAVAWWVYRETGAALYWCGAELMMGVAIAMIAMQEILPDAAGRLVTPLFIMAGALIWGGARRFDHHTARLPVMLAGVVAWLVASVFIDRDFAQRFDGLAAWAAISIYLFAAAWEIWRDNNERLFARWPLIVLLGLRATLFTLFFVDTLMGAPFSGKPELGTVFSLVNFEHYVFVIGTTVFLLVMIKERHELQHKEIAKRDSLSGLHNRGAFLEMADAMLDGHRKADFPLAILVFDIDKFKTINDTCGHAGGDRVIETFGTVARASVRAGDLVGRIGGEEFGVVLTNASEEIGFAFAERIRNGFSDACRRLDGMPIKATVSAGVAVSYQDDSSLGELLRTADDALYRAKSNGRNRTIVATSANPSDTPPTLRIA
jgi:diguanylate cyclase (GGDEF)-like protein